MKRIIFGALYGLLLLSSCGEGQVDCSLVLCRGNEPLRLEFIMDGRNVLADETYSENDIEVTGDLGEEGEIQVFTGSQGGTEAFLDIRDPEWEPGVEYAFELQFGNDRTIRFTTEFGETEGPCCGGFLIFESVSTQDAQVIENPGYVTLILD